MFSHTAAPLDSDWSSCLWGPVDTATHQAMLDWLCTTGGALLDTVGFLLWLATGKAGRACGRLSAPQIVYSQLLKGLAAVECKKYTVSLMKIFYI